MEIISYVQDGRREKKLRIPVLNQKARKENPVSLTYPVYVPEFRSFSAKKVRKAFSLRNFFKAVGSALSSVGGFIKLNVKSIVLCSAAAITVLFAVSFTGKLYFHSVNYTGPLPFESGESLDIANLNKLMASFALEGSREYDESGNLLDLGGLGNQNFTEPVSYQNYKVRSGDTISGIAKKFGLRNISTLISVNDIGNVRQLAAGQRLKIPSVDGIVYTVKSGDSINSIASKYGIRLEYLIDVNDLTSDILTAGQQLFIPGASLDSNTLRNAMGELFIMPISAKFRWTSPYGYRDDPIAHVKTFHTGTDMACPTGTPVLASMSGRIMKVGVMHRIYGNYVIIDHGNGYQTLYAHMSKTLVTKGQWVSQGTRIGLVGSTGYSTGPHLHFTVYKNGKLVDPMTILKK